MSGIFISYRRKDVGGHAGRLHEELVRYYGRDAVFMDIDSIDGGVDFRQRIHDALDASDIALVLIGDAWTAPGDDGSSRRIDREDDLVRREVAAALDHEKVVVVPVPVEGARIPSPEELPEDVSPLLELQVCPLRNSEWKGDVRRIRRAVDDVVKESSLQRFRRSLLDLPIWAGVAGATLALVLAIAIFTLLSAGDGGEACENLSIPQTSRERLSDVAGSAKPAVSGSVYYGSCGGKTYALASFPGGGDGVFVQSGLEWVDLGPIVAEKCERVPRELLESWKQYDC